MDLITFFVARRFDPSPQNTKFLQTTLLHGLSALSVFAVNLSSSVLVAELAVGLVELLGLLLEVLEILVLLLELLLESSKLAGLAGDSQFLALLGVLGGALVGLKLVLQAHDFKDHDVGAVENQGKEQCEAAEVHVALRVKLAGLDFESLGSHDSGSAIDVVRKEALFDGFQGDTHFPLMPCSCAAITSSCTR